MMSTSVLYQSTVVKNWCKPVNSLLMNYYWRKVLQMSSLFLQLKNKDHAQDFVRVD